MIHSIRKFLSSKFGILVAFIFLGLIALAFAGLDVADSGTFGGVSGGDRVAIVGETKVSTSMLSSAVSNEYQELRRQNPTATMESFVAAGGMTRTLDQLLGRTAIAEFGRMNGLRAGDRLVDSELIQIPSFHGADGRFDESVYRASIARQGLSEKIVRDDISDGLLMRQVMLPVSFGSAMPLSLVKRYAALLRERRKGAIGLLPSGAYAPKGNPTDAQLAIYYRAHRTEYLRPERRVIRYAAFDNSTLKNLPAPSEAEIAARFKRDSADYAASETRRMTQLIVPTSQAADAIVREVAAGKSLAAAAQEKGLATTDVGPVSHGEFAELASAAVAQAAFNTQKGAIAAPARGALGFYIVRVDNIESKSARTLDQVREQISTTLAAEQRKAALDELSSQVEDEIDQGSNLPEIAEKLGLEVKSVSEVLADGRIYAKAGETVPAELQPAISTAFDMREGEPQLTELVAGQVFLIYDVSDITPSTAAPLAEIRDEIVAAWRRSEGAKAAKLAADRVMSRVLAGETVPAAMAKEKVALPPPDNIDLNREQLSQSGRQVPAVLALLFSMAEGTTKKLEAPNNNGWFVVKLNDIETGKLADDDPIIQGARQQLTQSIENEQAEQLMKAISGEVGVERNKAAIDAVEAQLTGRNNQ
jgi:peptidyl-prolyl cis-trans isomerase D